MLQVRENWPLLAVVCRTARNGTPDEGPFETVLKKRVGEARSTQDRMDCGRIVSSQPARQLSPSVLEGGKSKQPLQYEYSTAE